MKYAAIGKRAGLVAILATVWTTSGLSAELEEVVVTAQKRSQSLQEVPISVSALTSSDLSGLNLTDRADITQQIPNFQVNTWSPNLTTFNIRGVSQNNFVDINEAPIAVYIDDVYMGSMNGISGQLYDMERVEVLRGPQGTLFGRNATGGLVHYLTKGASRVERNGYINGSYGSFGSWSLTAAVGGKMGNDRYRYRLSGNTNRSDGYIDAAPASQIAPELAAADKPPLPTGSLGGRNDSSFRLYFEFDVSDRVTLDFGVGAANDNSVPTGGYSFLPFGDSSVSHIPSEWFPVARGLTENLDWTDAEAEAFLRNAFFTAHPDGTTTGVGGEERNLSLAYDGNFANDGFAPISREGLTTFRGDSPDPHTNFSGYEGFLNRTNASSNIKVRYNDEHNNSLTYILAWNRVDKFYTEDGDGLPATIINFTTLMDYRQISQEIRFNKATEAGHHYQVGIYWMDLEYDGGAITEGAPAIGEVTGIINKGRAADADPLVPVDPIADQAFVQNTTNLSLFAEGDFRITDFFSMVVGGRYTSDTKDITYARSFTNDGEVLRQADALFALVGEISEPNFAGRLVFNFDLGSDQRHKLYLSLNRGIKGGGFNASSTVNARTLEYDAEVLTSYELGFKSDFTSELRFNTSVFFYDYKDYQAFSILGGTPNIANADATAQGWEMELKYTPGHFVMNLGLAWMNSDVDNITGIGKQSPPAGLPEIIIPVDVLNDKELPNAPSFSANFLFAYNFLIGSRSSLILQLDGAWYGDQFLEVTNGAGAFQSSYFLLNFATIWRSEFGDSGSTYGAQFFDVKLYVKNIADAEYKLYNLDLGILGSTAYYAPPFSWGIAFTWGYD